MTGRRRTEHTRSAAVQERAPIWCELGMKHEKVIITVKTNYHHAVILRETVSLEGHMGGNVSSLGSFFVILDETLRDSASFHAIEHHLKQPKNARYHFLALS